MMVTIDLAALAQTVGVWLLAVVVVLALLRLGGRSARWANTVMLVLWLLAVAGAASVLWMLL